MYDHMRRRHPVNFSLSDFHRMFLEDPKYLFLFNGWVSSRYNKQLKPSIDRIDSTKDYLVSNIQMLTWAENRFKQSALDGKRGRKSAVLQILGDKVVNRFPSQRHAVRQLGISQSNLSKVLNGKGKTAGGYGFVWEHPREPRVTG